MPFAPTYYGITDIQEQRRVDLLAGLLSDETMAFNVRWPNTYNNPRFISVEKAHDSQQVRSAGFLGLHETEQPVFPTGRTSPITLAQLAAWMGYREFYFLGIEQTHGYCYDPEARIDDGGGSFVGDKNPRYSIAIKDCAKIMRAAIEGAGGSVHDCTPGGLLNVTGKGAPGHMVSAADILPYRDLREVLG